MALHAGMSCMSPRMRRDMRHGVWPTATLLLTTLARIAWNLSSWHLLLQVRQGQLLAHRVPYLLRATHAGYTLSRCVWRGKAALTQAAALVALARTRFSSGSALARHAGLALAEGSSADAPSSL